MRSGAGSGSDTEGVSGTEGRSRPKVRLQKSPPGSPSASVPGSRSASPGAALVLPNADEIRGAIPPEGITIPDLIKKFRARIPRTKDGNTAFIALVRSVGRNAAHDKSLLVQK